MSIQSIVNELAQSSKAKNDMAAAMRNLTQNRTLRGVPSLSGVIVATDAAAAFLNSHGVETHPIGESIGKQLSGYELSCYEVGNYNHVVVIESLLAVLTDEHATVDVLGQIELLSPILRVSAAGAASDKNPPHLRGH